MGTGRSSSLWWLGRSLAHRPAVIVMVMVVVAVVAVGVGKTWYRFEDERGSGSNEKAAELTVYKSGGA